MRYFGTGESFLFKCPGINHSSSSSSINTVKNTSVNNGTIFFYPWVGKELCVTDLKPGQELFQAANENCLLIGGG
uniref:Uncharacterized protein n=1 Tax=Romanomermis culicivorax TaxID=13658 RepID=A0A915HVA0_ROMCU